MFRNTDSSIVDRLPYVVLGVLLGLLLIAGGVTHAAPYELATQQFKASELVDTKLIKGPNHTIQDPVVNKGYINHYRIKSPFGNFSVSGDAQVAKMVREIDVIAELKKMNKTEVMAESAAEALQKPVEAAKQLVDEPVETIKGIPAGIGRLFARAKDTLDEVSEKTAEKDGEGGPSSDEVVDAGSKLAKSYFGVSSAHRKLAKELEVDPYSRNSVLQEELNRVAKYAAAGSFGTGALMPSIPGVGLVTGVRDLVWNLSPQDLRLRNEKALAEMGADETLIARLFDNPHYTPSDRTRFVAGLEVMNTTEGRVLVVNEAAEAESPIEAMAYSRMTEMLAAYHKNRSPIKGFIESGRTFPLALTKADATVLAGPIDYLGWTELTEGSVRAYAKIAANQGAGGKLELWVEGRVSDQARAELGKLGWTVFDQAFQRLGG